MHHRNQETALSTLFKGDAGYCVDTRLEGRGWGWEKGLSFGCNGPRPEARIFLLPLFFPFKDETGKLNLVGLQRPLE